MNVWWCDKHNLQGEDSEHCEDGPEDSPRDDWCCMGEKQLVSVDALVIEKVDGEWPGWALRAMGTGFSAELLDALAITPRV